MDRVAALRYWLGFPLQLKPVVKGALTFIPGVAGLLPEGGGDTGSARYCYGVWLKHLVMLHRHGMSEVPPTLAELGPGSSLGTGLAALLSGANHYVALDVVKHFDTAANLRVFDQLVELFQQRAPRPGRGWPDFDAYLDERLFPSHILGEQKLRATLAPDRIARIRWAVAHPGTRGDISVHYKVPWDDPAVIEENSIDLILSHAVLGQVDDPETAYRALYRWLKPGGYMSHQIGFDFYGYTGQWNGYWAFPEPLWKLARGRRPFALNRLPRSAHLELLRRQGATLLCHYQCHEPAQDSIPRAALSGAWRHLSDDDLYCSGLFLQARKLLPRKAMK